MTDSTSDTDEIPVAPHYELERKPRLARTIRVLALPIVVVWLLIAVVVNVFVPQLEKVAEDVSVPLSPSDAPSVTGMKHIGEKFKEYDSDNLVLVTLVGDKPLGEDAHHYYDELVKKLKQDTKHVEHALDFWGQRFTASGVESYDHKSAYVQVNLRGDQGGAVGDKSVDAVRQIVADSNPPPGVKAYVAGQGALTDDTIVVGNASLFKMTIITIIIIAIMLMFVYRSIGTVLLTMVILFVGLATGRGVVALLGDTGIMGLSTFAVNLLTALAIAAGTDYAIFMVGRYQEGRERGLDREAAYYDTFAGVTKVVLGSGLTIVGALACLHFHSAALLQFAGVSLRDWSAGGGGRRGDPDTGVDRVRERLRPVRSEAKVQLHPVAPAGDGHRAVAGTHPRHFRHLGDRRRRGIVRLQPALQRPVLPTEEHVLGSGLRRCRSTLHPGPAEPG